MLLAKKERVLDYASLRFIANFLCVYSLLRKAWRCLSVTTFEGQAGGLGHVNPCSRDGAEGKGGSFDRAIHLEVGGMFPFPTSAGHALSG